MGLGVYIAGPYFYDIFRRVTSDQDALFYATLFWGIFFGLIALLEIPTGALADTIGRSRTVVASFVLYVISGLLVTLLFFCDNFIVVIVLCLTSRLTSALGYTLFNGSFSAWTVDAIRTIEPSFHYERILARGHAYNSGAQLIGALLGVTAYLHGVPYAAYLTDALLNLGCVTFCLAEMEEAQSFGFVGGRYWLRLVMTKVRATIRTGLHVCRQVPIIWWLLGAYAGFKFLLNVVDYLWPVAFAAQFGVTKWSVHWYFMIVAIPLLTILSARALAWHGDHRQRRSSHLSNRSLCYWLTSSFVAAAIPIIVLGILTREGIANFPFFAGAVLAVQCSYGIIEPCFETLVCNYIPAQNAAQRATILSMGSFLRGVLMLLLMVPSSGSSGINSPTGWILPAALLLLAAIATHWRASVYEQKTLPAKLVETEVTI